MSKDNLVYGLAGMVLGVIIGVLIANFSGAPKQLGSAPVAAPAMQQGSVAPPLGQQGMQQQLPEGHPPIDDQALRQQLVTQQPSSRSQT
jgi:hypothetical protein